VHQRLKIGSEVTLNVDNIGNAVSLRPSSSFINMVLTDYTTQQPMSEFHGNVVVQNKVLGNLPEDSAEIKQSSFDTLAENIVELAFNTNNALPKFATIVVAVPNTLP